MQRRNPQDINDKVSKLSFPKTSHADHAGQFLPDCQRRRVLEMGAAGLDHLRPILRLGLDRARELGFEIEVIRDFLSMAENPRRFCAKVDALARAHLQAIVSRIARLTSLKSELEHMIKA